MYASECCLAAAVGTTRGDLAQGKFIDQHRKLSQKRSHIRREPIPTTARSGRRHARRNHYEGLGFAPHCKHPLAISVLSFSLFPSLRSFVDCSRKRAITRRENARNECIAACRHHRSVLFAGEEARECDEQCGCVP